MKVYRVNSFKKMFFKLCAIILVLCLSFGVVACAADKAPASSKVQYDIDGNILEETILYEQLKYSDILNENTITEFKIREAKLIEENISEDVIVEDLKIEVMLADDIEGVLDEYFTSEVMFFDIDWGKIIGKFAVGTAVIIVTGVLALATAAVPGVGVVFATSCKEALKEGVIGAAVGAAIGTISGALKNGGRVPEIAKYVIEGAADGFMWGTITGALLGAYKGHQNYYANSSLIYKDNKLIGQVKGLDIVDNNGKIVGQITSNGWAVDVTGAAIGKLDDAGNVMKNAVSLIPSSGQITGSTGRVKYVINAGNQVIDKYGKIVGSINDAGQIYNVSGNLLGMVDDSGTLLSGLQKTINAGFNVDFAGKIVNATSEIGGKMYYLDDTGNAIGSMMQVQNSGGNTVTLVMKIVDPQSVKYVGALPEQGLNKIVGQIDDAGNLVVTWNKFFQVERSTGVRLAWQQEKALIEATGRGTYNWSAEELAELLTKGKVSGYQGHHINSALYSPHWAANPNNITFYSAAEHLAIGHHGNYQTVTFGALLSRAA